MNDNTTKLLEQLAAKLGTTSEYLWSILLKQAPISATIDIVYIIMTAFLWIVLYRLHKHFIDSDNAFSYDGEDVALASTAVVLNVTLFAFTILATIVCFFNLGDIFNGYFNPEFWALKYIINHLK